MTRKEYYDEIDLIDLAMHILKKWKMIVLCGCVGLVIGLVVSLVMVKVGTKNDAQQDTATLTEDEKAEVEQTARLYLSYQTAIDEYSKYLEESVWINLDPNAIPTLEVSYYVDNHYSVEYPEIMHKDNTNSILGTYSNMLFDYELSEKMGEVHEQYNIYSGMEELVSAEYEDGLITISISGPTKEVCQKVAVLIEDRIKEITPSVQATFGMFDITKVSEKYYVKKDSTIIDKRRSITDYIRTTKDYMLKLGVDYKDDKKEYYTSAIMNGGSIDAINVDNTIAETVGASKINYKYIVLIFIVIIIGYVGYVSSIYILGNKLHTIGEVSDKYGVASLGEVGKNCTSEMVAERIIVLTDKYGYKSLSIVGTYCDDSVKALIDVIKNNSKVKFVSFDDISINTNAEALMSATQTDATIIIEKYDNSSVKDIDREMELCQKYEINVVGAVVVA